MRATKIVVKLRVPTDATEMRVAAFVYDALTSWGGSFAPEDKLFHSLDIEHIQITDTKYTAAE